MPEILIKYPTAIVCVEVSEDSHWTPKTIAMRLQTDGLKTRVMGEFVIVEGGEPWLIPAHLILTT